jgi:hypothetical protein
VPNPVYSSQFILYTPSTPNSSFLVPAGFTAVVRQWTATTDVSDWLFQLRIGNSEAAPPCVVDEQQQAGIITNYKAEGHIVVPEGGYVEVYLSSLGSAPSMYVGGYLLRNTYAS